MILFFFNDTATTEIYTLSLHDALPISSAILLICTLLLIGSAGWALYDEGFGQRPWRGMQQQFVKRYSTYQDRKSTRLNSSHTVISYAVFCFKTKKRINRLS